MLLPPSPSSLATVSFRDEQFLIAEGLTPGNVLEYFYRSPFYVQTGGLNSINEMIRRGSIAPTSASRVDGELYMLVEMNSDAQVVPVPCVEQTIFVIQKFKQILNRPRTPLHTFYVLSGTVYLAPCLGQLLETHLTESVRQFEVMFDSLNEAFRGRAEAQPDECM